jgi:hypothetical protein
MDSRGEQEHWAFELTGQIVASRVLAPFINSLVISNQSAILMVTNATLQSQLFLSTDLKTWSPAPSTVTNRGGNIVFTTPLAAQAGFYRVKN